MARLLGRWRLLRTGARAGVGTGFRERVDVSRARVAGPAENDPEQQQQEAYEAVADDGNEGPLGDGCPHDGQHLQTSTDSGAASVARPMPRRGSGVTGLPKEAVLSSTHSVVLGSGDVSLQLRAWVEPGARPREGPGQRDARRRLRLGSLRAGGGGRREAGRGDVRSPGPPPRPRSLRRPLPPRRDRGGLCRGRSAASRHLLPLGRRLLRGRGR